MFLKEEGAAWISEQVQALGASQASCLCVSWRSAIHYLYIYILFVGPRVGKVGAGVALV